MTPQTLAAFSDEFYKIKQADQFLGSRIGRRPISVSRLLEREAEDLEDDDFEDDDLEKISKMDPKHVAALGFGGGAAAMYLGSKMNRDRQLGRQMRLQSTGGGY